MRKIISVLLAFVMIVGLLSMVPVEQTLAADTISGLVAEWKFDGDINESINSFVTENGGRPVTFIDGVFGKAAKFNGMDQYLRVTHDDMLNLGNNEWTGERNDNFSFSFWINLFDSKYNEENYILAKGQRTGYGRIDDCYWDNPYEVYFSNTQSNFYLNNRFTDRVRLINTGGNNYSSGKYIDGEEWYLMTYTYDGKTMKTYANDRLLKSDDFMDGISFNKDDLFIGACSADYGVDKFLKGALDNLRIYNRTLSFNDVEALYHEGVNANKELLQPTQKLVAHYKFDGDYKDSSDLKNNAEPISITGKIKFGEGQKGDAVYLQDGSYISIPAQAQLNFKHNFTISFWVKSTINDSQKVPLLSRMNPAKGNSDNDDDYTYKISWDAHESYATTDLSFNGYSDSDWYTVGSGYISASYSEEDEGISPNNWHHITYTYTYDENNDKGVLKVYVNGVLKGQTGAIIAPDVANAAGDLYIGYDSREFFNGAIDDIKIWNKCLTATQVNDEFGLGEEEDTYTIKNQNEIVKKGVITLKKGEKLNLDYITITDGDTGSKANVKCSNKKLTFKSSKKSIFTVSQKGVVKAKKKGKASIVINYEKDTILKFTVKVVAK